MHNRKLNGIVRNRQVCLWSLVWGLTMFPAWAGLFDLSVKDERKIGEDIMKQIKKEYAIYQDWEVSAIGDMLKRPSKHPELVAEFWVFPDPSYNAFALPGGNVMMNEGLLEALESRDEIAFILGHEITHVVERHIADQVERSRKQSALTSILLLATGANGTWWNVGDFVNFVSGNQYSRKKESEADDGGYALTAQVGYDPEAAITALEKLRKKYGDSSKTLNKLFGTHPLLKDREKRLEKKEESSTPPAVRPEVKPALVESGLPTLQMAIKPPPNTPAAKPTKKSEEPLDPNEWNDNAGKGLRAALNAELVKSEKLIVLHKWQLVRPKERPAADFSLEITPAAVTYTNPKTRDKIAEITVHASLVANASPNAIWQRDYESYNRTAYKKSKGGLPTALARDISVDVRRILVGEVTPPTKGTGKTTSSS